MELNFHKIEKKWHNQWEEMRINYFNEANIDKKLYCMEMFCYPSGANMHLGHWFNFGLADSWARFKRMQGYEVFQPIGFDAFGLPAENYAIKTNTHPSVKTYESIHTMRKQFKEMDGMFDWDHEVVTCDPGYYRWTEWIFLQLYKHGLAYKKEAPVNWCESCKTVLANEQAIGGECERCGSTVIQKRMNQWFFRITDYAQELIDGLDALDWPKLTKEQQRNWIGRSEGALIDFTIEGTGLSFNVYTTRPDTLFGVTYAVLAPEHALVPLITAPDMRKDVSDYIVKTARATEIERQSTTRTKTGVFTGAYAVNPINGKTVPVWISDYVLASYGAGAVMAVPAHDTRDYEFAKQFGLDIIEVISGGDIGHEAYTDNGILVNSGKFNGLDSKAAMAEIISHLENEGIGSRKVTYRLRDWLISRQRYWGAPIPIVYCDDCGTVPVNEEDLPVMLPENVEFIPTGESPLNDCKEFVETACPRCGKDARRETDTMDTFMCSSWYELRYVDAKNEKEAFNRQRVNTMLPVDKYIGGKEHICLHLIYSRFLTKALRDMGYLDFDEPFQSLVHQGIILGSDGQKMSKSKGNTISPDEMIQKYSSDSLRTYLMFGFNYTDGGPWSDDGIKGAHEFIKRYFDTIDTMLKLGHYSSVFQEPERELLYQLHFAIKGVTEDFEVFKFNTAIAKLMALRNAVAAYLKTGRNSVILKDFAPIMTQLISPASPHISEEFWSEWLGNKSSIFHSSWPLFDEKFLVTDVIEIPVQINGKLKGTITVPKDTAKDERIEAAKSQYANGQELSKAIYVPDKIINLIIKR